MEIDYIDWAHDVLKLTTPEPRPRDVERLASRLDRAGLLPGGKPYSPAMIAADFGREEEPGEYTLDPVLAVRALLRAQYESAGFMTALEIAAEDWLKRVDISQLYKENLEAATLASVLQRWLATRGRGPLYKVPP